MALKGDRDRYLKEGMDEYIPKPIILDKFFSILKDILADKIVADKKRALIYRETKIETRILEEIVKQLNFEIIISNSIDELIENIEYESFDILLTDRVKPDIVHEQIGKRLEEKSIPSILFIDKDTVVSGIDKIRFSLIKDKFTNYNDIKDSLNSLIK